MSSYVGVALRREVVARAERLCEYCLIHEDDTFLGCAIDHVVSEKHGGKTVSTNLAYACAPCNRAKGSDVGSATAANGTFVRFFSPRTDRWSDHFLLDGVCSNPLTEIGEVTVRLLGFNQAERLLEREALYVAGRYPTAAALARVLRPL